MKYFLFSILMIGGLGTLTAAASFLGWGVPPESAPLSVRLGSATVSRMHQGTTRSYGK